MPGVTMDTVMSASGLEQSKEDRADLVKHVLGGKCWKYIPRGDTKILGRMMKMMMFKSGAVLAQIDDSSSWFALVVNGTVTEEYRCESMMHLFAVYCDYCNFNAQLAFAFMHTSALNLGFYTLVVVWMEYGLHERARQYSAFACSCRLTLPQSGIPVYGTSNATV